jgi:hypothetical protein
LPATVGTQFASISFGAFGRKLGWAYNISSSGIEFIRTPTLDDLGFLSFIGPYYGYPPTDHPHLLDDSAWSKGILQNPYGAVHIYSGFSWVNAFPLLSMPPGPPLPNYFFPQFSATLAIANRNIWKQVHKAVGLDKVYDTIVALKQLNDPGVVAFNPGTTWTMREIYGYFQRFENAFYTDALLFFGSAPSAKDIVRRLHAASLLQVLDPTVKIAMPSPIGLRQALKSLLQATGIYVNFIV